MLKIALMITLLSTPAYSKFWKKQDDKKSKNKAIYGTDDRFDMFQTNDRIRKWGTALGHWTDVMKTNIDGDLLELIFPTLEEEYGVCKDEKFSQQPTSAIACTGFLVAPDLMLTAGHCMVNVGEAINKKTPQCEDFDWVFDYAINQKGADPLKGKSSSIVRCDKVIYAIHEEKGENRKDYALIKLNRPMNDRHYFKPGSLEEMYEGKRIAMMGFPVGLPLKYASDAFIKKLNPEKVYFEGTVDAVGGNSGSPVISRKGELLGILVRGNDDFVTDKKKKCDRWNICNSEGDKCSDGKQDKGYDSGMHIQKITPHILQLIQDNKG